jgi:hypothetical protein
MVYISVNSWWAVVDVVVGVVGGVLLFCSLEPWGFRSVLAMVLGAFECVVDILLRDER